MGGRWPLVRRAADDKTDPVELLVDITFVLALSQAAGLMRSAPGLTGALHAISALIVVVMIWQIAMVSVTFATVKYAPIQFFVVVQAGLFLALAVVLPEAFVDRPGGANGPVAFAVVISLNSLCAVVVWIMSAVGRRDWIGNLVTMCASLVAMSALAWASVGTPPSTHNAWLLGAYAAGLGVAFMTTLPTYRLLRVGQTDGWMIYGAKAYGDRYAACYIVACCLVLELLEQAGQNMVLRPTVLFLVLASLVVMYLMFRLYAPLVDPAVELFDMRNTSVSLYRKQFLNLGYAFGHTLMCCGLVISAGALQTLQGTLSGPEAGLLGPPLDVTDLAELYGGVAGCFLGQAFFGFATTLRVDPVRLVGPLLLVALIPLLAGSPLMVCVLVVLVVCATALRLDEVRRAREPRTRRAVSLLRRGRQRLTCVRFSLHSQVPSGFELLFDVMAAFTFAQTVTLVMGDRTAEGACRGLLLLTILWGCWAMFVWMANTADSEVGTVRILHLTGLIGLVFLGLALPRAFAEPGFNHRVAVFLAAYLFTHLGSAGALRVVRGRAAGRAPVLIMVGAVGTAGLVALTTRLPAVAHVPLWAAALACEAAILMLFVRQWFVAAPAHLAERFAFITIIGLDMSLSGTGVQLRGQPVGAAQLALVALALISCTVAWWLYFSLLSSTGEHHLVQADPARHRDAHNVLVHRFYLLGHLATLAGMTTYGLGLRAIAGNLAVPGTTDHPLGYPTAAALGGGMAVYFLAINYLWALLGCPPGLAGPLVAVVSLGSIPLLAALPPLASVAAACLIGVARVVAETRRRAITAEAKKQLPGLLPEIAMIPAQVSREDADAARVLADARLLKRKFDLLDVNGDGVLTWSDFTELINRLRREPGIDPALLTRAEIGYRALWNSMCDAMDLNGDNVITAEEYRAFMSVMARDFDPAAVRPGEQAAVALPLFSEFDLNGDFTITLAEFVASDLRVLRRTIEEHMRNH